ncbi:MAG: hypothetical protein QXQ70_09695, partial [Candidatus Caldarchaeum sp.]
MCGIVGYVGEARAATILVKSLKRLEYRGYDSAGIATIHDGKLYIEKDAGKIDEINLRLGFDRLPGFIGIAHTRWATHGAPTKVNAHPHTDCGNTIAVVHNGVLENFLQLKKELSDLNHVFVSKTDTEVIPHLLEEYLKAGESLQQAFIKMLRRLEGSYALAVVSSKHPDMLLTARKEAPLIIGVGAGLNMAASDITALLDMTREMVFLHDGDAAILTKDGYRIIRIDSG